MSTHCYWILRFFNLAFQIEISLFLLVIASSLWDETEGWWSCWHEDLYPECSAKSKWVEGFIWKWAIKYEREKSTLIITIKSAVAFNFYLFFFQYLNSVIVADGVHAWNFVWYKKQQEKAEGGNSTAYSSKEMAAEGICLMTFLSFIDGCSQV